MLTDFTANDIEHCKQFLNDVVKAADNGIGNNNSHYVMRSLCFCMTYDEIEGEVIDILNRYLLEISCPNIFVPHLICKVKELMLQKDLSEYQLQKEETDIVEYGGSALTKELQKIFIHTCRELQNDLNAMKLTKSSQQIRVSLHSVKNKRRKMEDRHICFEDMNSLFPTMKATCPQSVFGVFDGHGGTDAANYAAAQLVCKIAQCEKLVTQPGESLREAIVKTDHDFILKAKRERLKSGATAVVVLIQDKNFTLAWLGDSQAVLCKDGAAIQLMEPHKPDRQDERDRIEALGGCVVFFGGWRVNGLLSVSRAIGDSEQKPFITGQPDVEEFQLEGDEEFVIVACDGLWDTVDPYLAVQTVRDCVTEGKRNDAAEILVELAKTQHSMDNITVMVVYFDFNQSHGGSNEGLYNNPVKQDATCDWPTSNSNDEPSQSVTTALTNMDLR